MRAVRPTMHRVGSSNRKCINDIDDGGAISASATGASNGANLLGTNLSFWGQATSPQCPLTICHECHADPGYGAV